MKKLFTTISEIPAFYIDGFRNMPLWGRKLWIIILIKLFIIFAVLKLFFFPDFLNRKYTTDEQKAVYVLDQITNSPLNND